jgi:hypothetical protein
MKYLMLFVNLADEVEAFQSSLEDVRGPALARVDDWARKYQSRCIAGGGLAPASSATTVRFTDRFGEPEKAIITDGPFVEMKEVIGGFWIVDVADLDEALQMAKEWPGSRIVDIRPIVEASR